MSTLLHAGALVLAAIAAGALCVGGRRTRPAEAAAGVAMLVGMTDAMTVSVLPAALWSAVLLAAAIGLAVRHRWTAAVPVSPAPVSPVPVSLAPAEPGGNRAPISGRASAAAGSRSSIGPHLALGLVATATLILLMPARAPGVVPVLGAHGHGGGSPVPILLAVLALGTVVATALALRRDRSWPHRVHHAAMAASTLAMTALVA
ncbi:MULTISPECIES: hypothetical protein [unclassified Microbacterium]|uniref:hypothetical protein n=1 Tax=unclassified Microbacterium TaxID=2609290 RepID=UPI00300FB89F